MLLEPSTGAGLLLGSCTVLVAIFLLYAHLSDFKQKVPLFYCWLGAIAVLGGAAAFFLPIAVNSGFKKDDDGSALRQALLYTTGGLLGVITLGETHRKNNQEKEKNENDHTRQVYAERRSRYTKAVEQLANDKVSVRLGGIYTLVGLVDEWLADGTLNPEKRQKEGQVIINNLCAYIRAPFPHAASIEIHESYQELEELRKKEPEHLSIDESWRLQYLIERFKNYTNHQEPDDTVYTNYYEEQDTRRTIFLEMSKRSSTLKGSTLKEGEDNERIIVPGPWSIFEFDFTRAPIFYELNDITIEKGNFSSAAFFGGAYFSNTLFAKDAHFDNVIFASEALFNNAIFAENAYFNNAYFAQNTYFQNTSFFQNVYFIRAYHTGYTTFDDAIFIQNAEFGGTSFAQEVEFKLACFKNYEPAFIDDRGSRARFSARVDAGAHIYNMFLHKDSKPIHFGTATLLGKSFEIPVGTVLFDPESWDKEKQDYIHSAPAKPLDDSDKVQENKTE